MGETLAVNRRPGRMWAFLQFPLTRIVLAALALAVVIGVIQVGAKALGIQPRTAGGLVIACLIMLATLATYYAFVHAIERRRVVELGTQRAAPEFASGFLVGMFLFALTMLVLWSIGDVDVSVAGGWPALGYPLLDALIAAVTEETLMRGVLFRIIEEGLGSWIALALSAAAFGALHAFNPGATTTSSIAIALEAGVLLAAVFMFTRRLWMVIGVHTAWNFTEGGIFGASVSGTDAHGMFASRFNGPDVLTGGAFGPEASIIAVLVCLFAGATFLALAHQRGHVVPPFWARR
ncbi:MAG TPA: type II CAAX endopeptidase family protein [Rhodanobacteraceae bacterium]|nr:type II CAAX endopeptidase family protein [Rhodanobacteraceae bacterium]